MKHLSQKILLMMASCLLVTVTWADDFERAEPEEVGLSGDRLARFSALMEEGIEEGHFPGAVAAVARNGKIAFFRSYGLRDKEAGLPMQDESIFRIASMTKAVTGVAVMILYEEGHFSLHDPISKFIPSFSNPRVLVSPDRSYDKYGDKKKDDKDQNKKSADKKDWSEEDLEKWLKDNWDTLTDEEQEKWLAWFADKDKTSSADSSVEPETVAANRPIRIRDLLRHTAGFGYNVGNIWEPGDDLEALIDNLAAQPLSTHPGTEFQYGLSMDVLARLVEVVSGQTFDVFIRERIFDPLEMNDSGFQVPKDAATRLVKMPGKESTKKGDTTYSEDSYLSPPIILMGGTGLVSTTMDYLRFCQMLLNNGELEGVRILGRKSVELMRANHMNDVPGSAKGSKLGGEFQFGLTFGVKGKPGDEGALGSEGSYYWGGAYGTTFWIDPNENLTGVFMVNGFDDDRDYDRPYSGMLQHFTYQAIID